MNKEKSLTEGEALLLLVRRSGKSGVEIAKLLNIHPNHLSKLFKSERLTSKLKNQAAEVFNVPLSAFDTVTGAVDIPLPDVVNEPETKYEAVPRLDSMSVGELLEYLERKDIRYHEERSRLIGLLERKEKNHQEERGILLATIEKLTGK